MECEVRHLSEEQKSKIQKAVREILEALGEDPDREGLKDTPDRVCRMYDEVFEGMRFSNEEIAMQCGRCFTSPAGRDSAGNMVVMTGIDAFSYCEHHLALMYNMKVNVAYIPKDKIIGLSKIPRIVDMVTKRLQLQERIGSDIAEILSMVLDTEDVMVVITGEHSCMTSRGIKKPGAVTKTVTARGIFNTDMERRMEFLSII